MCHSQVPLQYIIYTCIHNELITLLFIQVLNEIAARPEVANKYM